MDESKSERFIGSIQRSLIQKSGKRNGQTMYTYYLQVIGYTSNQAVDFGEMMISFPKRWADLSA
ncbi:MAG: hypothetical protein M3Z87_10745 [Lactobacillus sp.]|nr:hypothetical protein [Lactobacillus sp.]